MKAPCRENNKTFEVVIVGGGITGLATLYRLQELFPERKDAFLLLESEKQVGGKIDTECLSTSFGDFLLEKGPDSFITQKPWGVELSKSLGLSAQFQRTKPVRNTYILRKEKLKKMPDGMMLMIPTRIWPFVTTSLFTFKEKIRACFELFVPKKTNETEESIKEFVARRFGIGVLNYLAEPLLSGIYSGDPARQSLKATFPQFIAIEKKNRSLIKTMFAKKSNKQDLFLSFKKGMRTLVDSLDKKLKNQIKTQTPVETLCQLETSLFELTVKSGEKIRAKHVVLTTSAALSAKLLKDVSTESANKLQAFPSVPSGCVYLGFKREDVQHPLNGFGIVLPAVEKKPINAITWTSSKLDNRAPEGTVLLRVFVGGSRNPNIFQKSDEEISTLCSKEANKLLSITGQPIFTRLFKKNHENPQYNVGHLQRISEVNSCLPKDIYLAGSSFGGVGIPDCIKQGFEVAEVIHKGIV